jgi:hypothetical protein
MPKKGNVRFALSSARLVLASLSCLALRLKPRKTGNVRFAPSSARLALASLSCFALRLKPRKTGTGRVSVPAIPPLYPS